MNRPAISIITTSFNHGRFIERTIQSVVEQGIEDLEHHVVDGGSTDGTLEILKAYKDRLRFVSEPDQGQTDAINKGIRATTGEIFGWLNSDDIYYPGALAAVLAHFAAHPDVDVVYGDARHIDENDEIIEPYYTEDWDYQRLKEVCYLCQPAVFVRRRLVEKVGLLDPNLCYCMDYEYWLRLGALTPFSRMPYVVAGSRLHRDTKTLSARKAVHREINDMLRRTVGEVADHWIYAYAHVVTEAHGAARDTARQNLNFVLRLIGNTVASFLRWRRCLPLRAIRTMAAWAGGTLNRFLNE